MKRSSFLYTSCYCEENVYKLLERLVLIREKHLRAVNTATIPSDNNAVNTATIPSATIPSSAASTVHGEDFIAPEQLDAYAACFISAYHSGSDAVDTPPELSTSNDSSRTTTTTVCYRELREVENVWDGRVPIFVEDPLLTPSPPQPQESRRPTKSNSYQGEVEDPPFVMWDYHVIAMVRHAVTKLWYVIDFDTRLRPSDKAAGLLSLIPVSEYIAKSFCPLLIARDAQQAGSYQSRRFFSRTDPRDVEKLFCCSPSSSHRGAKIQFRVVPAERFLSQFRSLRTHMKKKTKVQPARKAPSSANETNDADDPSLWQMPPPAYKPIVEPSPFYSLLKSQPTTQQQPQATASPNNTQKENERKNDTEKKTGQKKKKKKKTLRKLLLSYLQ